MMKTTFTFLTNFSRATYLVLFMLLGWSVTYSQSCVLACTGQTNVSVDAACEAEIDYTMLLNANMTSCPNGVFEVELRHNGVLLTDLSGAPTNIVTSQYIGKTLEAKVIDVSVPNGNSCWGWVLVEDKLAPTIDCASPGDITCFESRDIENYLDSIVVDNCNNYEIRILENREVINNCANGLASNLLKQVTITFEAVDRINPMFKSAPCTFTYGVTKLAPTDTIVPPANRLIINNTALSCNNANIDPSNTGYPTINGTILNPNEDLPCNLLVNYTDDTLKNNGCQTKIVRTWRIMEWSCDPRPMQLIPQIIEINDTIKPTISLSKRSYTFSTTAHSCEGVVTLDPAVVGDECSMGSVIIVGGATQINGNGGTTTLAPGVHTLRYIVSDKCGNTAMDSVTVTVEDLTKPVAVCDEHTTVSLTNEGTAWVPARVFDDGSYDECSLAKMLVRRDEQCEDCEISHFDDFITLGEYNGHYYYLSRHKIESRLADKHGVALGGYLFLQNSTAERNWVIEQVKAVNDTLGFLHKLTTTGAPQFLDVKNGNAVITNVPAMALYNYVIEINEKCGWSSYVKFCCGDVNENNQDVMVSFRVVDKACNFNDCMVFAEVQNKVRPTLSCPAPVSFRCDNYFPTGDNVADFGPYDLVTNCEDLTPTDVLSGVLNQCNVGTLTRTVSLTSGGITTSCTQTISVTAKTYDYDDIVWPADRNFTECADPDSSIFSPDNLGRPEFPGDDQCSLLGSDYEDFVYTFNNSNGDACFKIIRRWTVIDWCNLITTNNGTQYYTYSHDQVIKVSDSVRPTITGCTSDVKEAKTYDNECEDGYIELLAMGSDNCTDVLDWSYKIDANNDGSFDAGFSKSGKGNSIDASGTYPVGQHRVQYTFVDRCGNVSTCDQVFEIINYKAPTPYCINGLAVDLMPVDSDNDGEIDGGMVELWASDFDRGSFHSCDQYDVLVSFSPDVNDINKTFTCDDFGRAPVMLYASVITERGDTLRSFCNTFVDIQDNMDACPDNLNNKYAIQGKLRTEDNLDLANATVELKGAEIFVATTNTAGEYSFPAMPEGSNYDVVPVKNDDVMNGVSTLDLVLMQRHILNINKFNTPYKYIAADINKDSKVAASDLVELRKVILGVSDKFTNNNSWRFIDASNPLPANSNPLNYGFDELYAISNLNNAMTIDFTSVKVGDVNGSAKANARDKSADPRTAKTMTLSINNASFDANTNQKVTIVSKQKENVTGMQFTISFDANTLTFEGVNGLDLEVDETNFGLNRLEEGIITFSWNEVKGVDVANLFELSFNTIGEGTLANTVSINSGVTVAEAYDADAQVINLEYRSTTDLNTMVLYQNVPNPFNASTTVAFTIPTAGEVELAIMDVTGKMLYNESKTYQAGYNTVTLSKNDLNLSGVMYYQVSFGGQSQVKKMVIID